MTLRHDGRQEKGENEPPERVHLSYVSAEAVILGQRLRRIAQLLQRGELENIRTLDRRYAGLRQAVPIIFSILATRKKVV